MTGEVDMSSWLALCFKLFLSALARCSSHVAQLNGWRSWETLRCLHLLRGDVVWHQDRAVDAWLCALERALSAFYKVNQVLKAETARIFLDMPRRYIVHFLLPGCIFGP